MKFRDVAEQIGGIPFTSMERGREIYEHVIKTKPRRCLELGFAHGVATCYVAAALDETGSGHLDAVDLVESARDPSAEDLLEKCGLESYVTLHREKNSYTWFLKKKIEEMSASGACETVYDLCFVDGPKNWTIDGAAFFMVDKLLNANGTIIFDDYSYAYASVEGATDGIAHRLLGDDERREPHIKSVFHLLVVQHSQYGKFQVVNEQWAWACKTGGGERVLTVREHVGLRHKAFRSLRRLRALARSRSAA